jgi:hypothetical protein
MYAKYEIQGSTIILNYTSRTGEFMGRETFTIKNKLADPQELAYSFATGFARTYRTDLQALMRIAPK